MTFWRLEKKPMVQRSLGYLVACGTRLVDKNTQSPNSRNQVEQKEKPQFQLDDHFVKIAQDISVKIFKMHSECVARSVETVKSSELYVVNASSLLFNIIVQWLILCL